MGDTSAIVLKGAGAYAGRMPEIKLDPKDYRAIGAKKPSWWARLNAKPANWDEPGARTSRLVMAIILGLGLMWIRSRH
jgi:hypothetical protein